VRHAAKQRRVAGGLLIDKPEFRAKLAQVEIEAMALQAMILRLMEDAAAGADSGPRGSMVKLRWSELTQQATALWVAALGPRVQHFKALDGAPASSPDMPFALQGALYSRVTTIYGGSSEIQRNIIARRSLGL
jgi:alkylation response protein AidB-like acyl-CoA dehydrogenase